MQLSNIHWGDRQWMEPPVRCTISSLRQQQPNVTVVFQYYGVSARVLGADVKQVSGFNVEADQ